MSAFRPPRACLVAHLAASSATKRVASAGPRARFVPGCAVHGSGLRPWPNLAASRRGDFGSHQTHRPLAGRVGKPGAQETPEPQAVRCLTDAGSNSFLTGRRPGRPSRVKKGAAAASTKRPCPRACARSHAGLPALAGTSSTKRWRASPCGWRHKSPGHVGWPVATPANASCRCFAPRPVRPAKAARGVVASRAKPIRTAPPVGCCAKRSIRGAGCGSWAGDKLNGAQAHGVRLSALGGGFLLADKSACR